MEVKETDIAWLAGLLEGEGSFCWHQTQRDKGRPRIQIQMTDKDVLDKAAILLRGKVLGPYGPYTTQKIPSWFLHCSGKHAIFLMEKLLPYMGERRSLKINELIKKYKELNEDSLD